MNSAVPRADWRGWLTRVKNALLERVWYVHEPLRIDVSLSPGACLHLLATLARPRMQRLEYRELFAQGRRYTVEARRDGGFVITTTAQVLWQYRRRTSASTLLYGYFEPLAEQQTALHLRARIRLSYLLSIFPVPIFMTSILVFMPWPPPFTGALIALLFGLSWFGHRYHARLEAHEMVFFVQKVLEEQIIAAPAQLSGNVGHVVYEREAEFARNWARFMEEQRGASAEEAE